MTNKNYLDLAVRYGGYMENDKEFLNNRLSQLTERQTLELLVPPPSVINAYFSELYQKRRPKDATAYFFQMSKAFSMYFAQPAFGKEGAKGFETFRFIRLNIDGRAYGYAYLDDTEEAIVFSELPQPVTDKFLFNLAQIFPHYVIYQLADAIHMHPAHFEPFGQLRDLSALTQASENTDFLKFYGYNIDNVIEKANECFTNQTLYQFKGNQFIIYQRKG